MQVAGGRHLVRRLPAGGHPRKSTGLRQHFLSRHRVGRNPEAWPGGKADGANIVLSFAKGEAPNISPL